MFFSIASTTGRDMGQRFAAFKNAKSVGTRNRDRTSRQNFSSGSAGVRGRGAAEYPSSSRGIDCWPKARDGSSDAEPDSARNRAKSRRERFDTRASSGLKRRMYHPLQGRTSLFDQNDSTPELPR